MMPDIVPNRLHFTVEEAGFLFPYLLELDMSEKNGALLSHNSVILSRAQTEAKAKCCWAVHESTWMAVQYLTVIRPVIQANQEAKTEARSLRLA